jgi:hypothetical protein
MIKKMIKKMLPSPGNGQVGISMRVRISGQ